MSEIKSWTEEREQTDSMFHPTEEIEETYLLKSESQRKKQPLHFHLTDEETTLTSYLELDTWTPEQAACLVAGIRPESFITIFGVVGHYRAESLSGLTFMEKDAFLLDNAWKCGYHLDTKEMCGVAYEAFSQRTRVLELWNSREETPPKIKPSDFIAWCTSKSIDTTWLAEVDTHSGQNASTAKVEGVPRLKIEEPKPWSIAYPGDPEPAQPWYTPARYFARELVKDDSTLLTKKMNLAEKTATSLAGVGIFKRGKTKKQFSAGTVLKSFVNVALG